MNKTKRKFRLIFCFSLIFCIILFGVSLCLGNVCYSPSRILLALSSESESDRIVMNIIRYARLPRILAAFLSGGALAVSGAILQNVLANKLASPGIIGVNAGAGLGVTLCGALGIYSGWWFSVSAFAGSLLTVLLIVIFSRKFSASRTTVILAGVALNSILNAFSESITVLDPDIAALTTEFRIGGFSALTLERLIPASIFISAALILVFLITNELDLLTLGDESAQGLGLKVLRWRRIFLILAALLAGCSVSFAGLLGFIGLIVPHLVRKLIGNESRYLLPLSLVIGAGFTALCDLISRLLFMPYELPVGVLMALIGGPCFVFLLVRSKGGHTS